MTRPVKPPNQAPPINPLETAAQRGNFYSMFRKTGA